jgi:hypothetical protein
MNQLTEDEKRILKDLWKTSYGKVLFKYLEIEYSKIGDITTANSWDEVLGRQHAFKLLKKLFSFGEEEKPPRSNNSQYV